MPLYEYRCLDCGEVFEALQRFSDKPLKKCRFCQGKVEQLISNSSFQLKGSGWYLTDYAKKPGGGSKGDAKPSAETGGTKGEASAKSEKTTSKAD